MTYTNSYYMVNKQQQLMKMMSFYEKQIEVLDEMLDEIAVKMNNPDLLLEKENFHKRFDEKQQVISVLKNEINKNNYMLTTDIAHNQGRMTDLYYAKSRNIEEKVASFEKEVNALNKDFKMYLLETI